MVVIAIIGLLSSVILVSLGGVRGKARDARRIREIDTLSKALALYYVDNGHYPKTDGWIRIEDDADNNGPFSTAMKPYLPTLPRDPLYDPAAGLPYDPAIGGNIFSYQYLSSTEEQLGLCIDYCICDMTETETLVSCPANPPIYCVDSTGSIKFK